MNMALLFAISLMALAYAVGLIRLWRRAGSGRSVSRVQALGFGAGIMGLTLASLPMIHELAEHYFWGHMLQHLILMMIAAPLLVLGAPSRVLLWVVPRPGRRALGQWWTNSALRRAWDGLTTPIVAWVLSAAVVWIWHLPAAYQAALRHDPIHTLEHASFLGSAVLFWWVVLGPASRRRLSRAMGVLYLLTAGIQSGMLGALLTFAGTPLYPAQSPGASGGLSPLEDQQLAGLIMWLPGGLIYLVAAGSMFLAWMRAEETRLSLSEVPIAIRES